MIEMEIALAIYQQVWLIRVTQIFMYYLGTSLSAPTHSSNRPMRIADTSRYGSHTGKPRPIRSIAARLIGVCAGSFLEGGCCNRNVNALPRTDTDERVKHILKETLTVTN